MTAAKKPDYEVIPPEQEGKAFRVRERRDVAVQAPPAQLPAVPGTADVLGMIERMAANKDVDADKLEKLIGLQERVMDRNARDAFDAALLRMRPDLPLIARDGRIEIGPRDRPQGGRTTKQSTPYAKWETMMPAIDPVLTSHGFTLTHRISTAPDGRVRVTAVLKGHGHTDDSCYFDLPIEDSGSKNKAQGWGSSVSYGKRYTACAVLNIVTRGEDDDAKTSGDPVMVGTRLKDDQVDLLRDLQEAVGAPADRFVNHLNVNRPHGHPPIKTINDLPAERYDEAVETLRGYEANAKAKQEAKQRGGTQ